MRVNYSKSITYTYCFDCLGNLNFNSNLYIHTYSDYVFNSFDTFISSLTFSPRLSLK